MKNILKPILLNFLIFAYSIAITASNPLNKFNTAKQTLTGLRSLRSLSFQDPRTWNSQTILKILKKDRLKKREPMKKFLFTQGHKALFTSQTVELITLESGLQGVFKKRSLEYCDTITSIAAEIIAYQASRAFGFPNIPPTVKRTIDNIDGSFQMFVTPLSDFFIENNYGKTLETLNKDELANTIIFWFLMGRRDNHPGNMVISKETKSLISIDNESIKTLKILHYGYDYPFVSYCPSKTLKILESLNYQYLKFILRSAPKESIMQTNEYIEEILYRRDQMVAYFKTKKLPHSSLNNALPFHSLEKANTTIQVFGVDIKPKLNQS